MNPRGVAEIKQNIASLKIIFMFYMNKLNALFMLWALSLFFALMQAIGLNLLL
jgi:hypothetical protein